MITSSRLRISIAILLYPLFFPNISAQKILTLEQCEEIALNNNLDIQKQKYVVQRYGKYYKQSYFNLTPDVSATGGINYNVGRTLNDETYEWANTTTVNATLGASASITLFNGLRQINFIRQNKFNLWANKENFEKLKSDIKLTVNVLYYQVLLNQELLSTSQKQFEITNETESRVKLTSELGRAPRSAVLEILAQKSLENQIVETNANNLKYSYFLLQQVMNPDSAFDFEVAKPNDITPDNSVLSQNVDSIFSISLLCLPQIKSASYMLKSSHINTSLIRGNRSPRLTLSAGTYSRYNRDAHLKDSLPYLYLDQFKDNRYQQVSLNLSIPLYNRNSINNSISIAKIMTKESELDLEQAKLQLYQDIQRNKKNAVEAYNRYLSSTERLSYTVELFEDADVRFSKGFIGALEYKIAKNNYLTTQSDLLCAKYQYYLALKNLNYYLCK
jgi:outer membrane protein